MADPNLFLPICGTLLFVLVLITAILGMRARFSFARRLRKAYNDKEKIDNWLKANKTKQRLLLLVSLTASLGILILGALTLSGILVMSKTLLIVFTILLLAGALSGTIMLIDYERLAK